VDEDVDVIALSVLSAAHMPLFKKITQLIKKEKLEDVWLVAGGIIPLEDQKKLKALGVSAIFGPGTDTLESVRFIQKWQPKPLAAHH